MQICLYFPLGSFQTVRINDFHCLCTQPSDILAPASILRTLLDQQLVIGGERHLFGVVVAKSVKRLEVIIFSRLDDLLELRTLVEKTRFGGAEDGALVTVQKGQRTSATLGKTDANYVWYSVLLLFD